jgi:hypothetical protein
MGEAYFKVRCAEASVGDQTLTSPPSTGPIRLLISHLIFQLTGLSQFANVDSNVASRSRGTVGPEIRIVDDENFIKLCDVLCNQVHEIGGHR